MTTVSIYLNQVNVDAREARFSPVSSETEKKTAFIGTRQLLRTDSGSSLASTVVLPNGQQSPGSPDTVSSDSQSSQTSSGSSRTSPKTGLLRRLVFSCLPGRRKVEKDRLPAGWVLFEQSPISPTPPATPATIVVSEEIKAEVSLQIRDLIKNRCTYEEVSQKIQTLTERLEKNGFASDLEKEQAQALLNGLKHHHFLFRCEVNIERGIKAGQIIQEKLETRSSLVDQMSMLIQIPHEISTTPTTVIVTPEKSIPAAIIDTGAGVGFGIID